MYIYRGLEDEQGGQLLLPILSIPLPFSYSHHLCFRRSGCLCSKNSLQSVTHEIIPSLLIWHFTPFLGKSPETQLGLDGCFDRRNKLVFRLFCPHSPRHNYQAVVIDARGQRQKRVACFNIHGNIKERFSPKLMHIFHKSSV